MCVLIEAANQGFCVLIEVANKGFCVSVFLKEVTIEGYVSYK